MHGLRSEEVITGKGGAERKAVDGVEGVNDSERGEQLAEHEVVDSMQCKMHVACDFVALDRTTDSAALLLLQFLAKLVQAAAHRVKAVAHSLAQQLKNHLPSFESSMNGLYLPSL